MSDLPHKRTSNLRLRSTRPRLRAVSYKQNLLSGSNYIRLDQNLHLLSEQIEQYAQ
jgi:hypothetical protein